MENTQFAIGDQFTLTIDLVDDDDGKERVTPAGTPGRITSIDDYPKQGRVYGFVFDATGGSGFLSEEETKDVTFKPFHSLSEVSKTNALVINAPEFFKDPEFVGWLNADFPPKFTWHQGGSPGSYSDVVVLVDPSLKGEGSDSEMPTHIWVQIVETCKKHFSPNTGQRPANHIMVWLKNL
jgi:hypothetical protein